MEKELESGPASEQESELEWRCVCSARAVVVEGAPMVEAVAVVVTRMVVVAMVLMAIAPPCGGRRSQFAAFRRVGHPRTA